MISLSRTTDTIQAFLSGAAATTNPTALVFYHDIQVDQKFDIGEYPIGRSINALSGTNEIEILAAPSQNVCRHIDVINIFNPDTAAITVTVVLDDSGTNRILVRKLLAINQALIYSGKSGWQIV